MKTKITFSHKNFNKGNTPVNVAMVANKLLIIGSVISAVGLTIAAPPFGIAAGIQIAAYAGGATAIIKAASKLFGQE